MKPLIQQLPLNEHNSFVAQTFRTPDFEVGWHQHQAVELILFTEGTGLSFIGNHVGEFKIGDSYLLGSNLPHTFQKGDPSLVTSAIVVQFNEDFWGEQFLNLPESRAVRQLLANAAYGLRINGKSRQELIPFIKALEIATGFQRILLLGECLQLLATTSNYIAVSTQEVKPFSDKDQAPIDRIIQFTIDNFREPITLSRVAGIVCMSIPSFCNYFKKSTKKTYIDFLNEIRIGYACKLLMDTPKTITETCFESGYNTVANFHQQFFRIKSTTPLQYRKNFMAKLILPQRNIHTTPAL